MSKVRFHIGYESDTGEAGVLVYDVKVGSDIGTIDPSIPRPLMVSANYENEFARHNVQLTLNGQIITPSLQNIGFYNIKTMFMWMVSQWSAFGVWHWVRNNNTIVGYINHSIAQTGNLKITELKHISADFPVGQATESGYILVFKKNGKRIRPWDDANLYEQGEVLDYAKRNYSEYGNWGIEGNSLILVSAESLDDYSVEISIRSNNAAFSDAFSDGFEI